MPKLLAIISFLFLIVFSTVGQSYLEENFSSGIVPPTGWTIDFMEDQWAITSTANAGGESPEIVFQWVQAEGVSRLISPSFNLEAGKESWLSFRHHYDDYLGEGPSIGVAVREAAEVWTSIWELLPNGNIGPEEVMLLISNGLASTENLQISFYLTGDLFNLDYWFLDDVLVFSPRNIDIRLFLEGPYQENKMSTALNDSGLLPLEQPFNSPPWNYSGYENVAAIPADHITDWVLVELWEHNPLLNPEFSRVSQQACFVDRDGYITTLDGESSLSMIISETDNLYIWIHHRNHLSAILPLSQTGSGEVACLDLAIHPDLAIHGMKAMKEDVSGKWMLAAGDGNSDGQIGPADKYEVWMEQNGSAGYLSADFNMDGIVNQTDIDKYWSENSGRQVWLPDTVEVPFPCGDSLIDIRDGKSYATVQIGDQCWMSQNLAYEVSGSWCYDNSDANCSVYGRLYSWEMIMAGAAASSSNPSGVQGICPIGWHVPSDPEWCVLTDFIDSTVVCDTSGYNGTDCGFKMKSVWGWSSGGNGTNESGFNALPGGCVGIYHFDDLYLFSYHWTSSEDYPGFALLYKMNYGLPKIGRYFSLKNRGYSLRCVKD